MGRQRACAHRRCQREHRRQRDWDRREKSHQDQRHDFRVRQRQRIRIDGKQDRGSAVEQGKVADHPHHDLLLRAFNFCRADEFCGAAEFCALAGRGHFRDGLAAPHKCACIGRSTCSCFYRNGLACEHGLVEKDRTIQKMDIRNHHCAKRQFHDVARHQTGRRHGRPIPVAPDRCDERQARLEGIQSRLRTAFLEES